MRYVFIGDLTIIRSPSAHGASGIIVTAVDEKSANDLFIINATASQHLV